MSPPNEALHSRPDCLIRGATKFGIDPRAHARIGEGEIRNVADRFAGDL